jgi:putative (di)nucleoside polyphosphate hydrolase
MTRDDKSATQTASDEQKFLALPYRPCVGAVLFNPTGLVWVGKRIPKPGDNLKDAWQMPQGGIDDGEDPESAVFRELMEEVGTADAEIIAETDGWLTYDLPEHLRGVSWGGHYRGQKQKWFALRFLGDDKAFDLNVHKQPEFSTWRWASLIQLPEMIVPFKRDVYSKVASEFQDLPKRLSQNQ